MNKKRVTNEANEAINKIRKMLVFCINIDRVNLLNEFKHAVNGSCF
jgi:hypothetical protein